MAQEQQKPKQKPKEKKERVPTRYRILARHDTMEPSVWVDLGEYTTISALKAKEAALTANDGWKARVQESPGSVLLQAVAKWNPKPVDVEQPPPRWKF